jgi:uncharacterized membrane protein YgcG
LVGAIFKAFENETAKSEGMVLVRGEKEFTRAGHLMHRVVTDAEFTRARDLGARGAFQLIQARTNSWALCYYLARMRTAGVMRLYAELANLPRDMEPEPAELLACFCRSFDVADLTGSKMDPVKFEALAKDWLGFMQTVKTPGTEVNLGVQGGGSGGPGAPGGPGGGGKAGGGGGGPSGSGKP